MVTNRTILETGVSGLQVVVDADYDPPCGQRDELGTFTYHLLHGERMYDCGGRVTIGRGGMFDPSFEFAVSDAEAAQTLRILRRLRVIGPREEDDEEDLHGRSSAQVWADGIVEKAGMFDPPEPLWLVVDDKPAILAEGASKDEALEAFRRVFVEDGEDLCVTEANPDTVLRYGGTYLVRASDRLTLLRRWRCPPCKLEWNGSRLEVRGV
jgi:hypothetical protein